MNSAWFVLRAVWSSISVFLLHASSGLSVAIHGYCRQHLSAPVCAPQNRFDPEYWCSVCVILSVTCVRRLCRPVWTSTPTACCRRIFCRNLHRQVVFIGFPQRPCSLKIFGRWMLFILSFLRSNPAWKIASFVDSIPLLWCPSYKWTFVHSWLGD
jgi:hypothetical protein